MRHAVQACATARNGALIGHARDGAIISFSDRADSQYVDGSDRWHPTVGELAEAVVRREFVVHYQPQVEAASGNVVGVEALVRWQHPQHGLIAPDAFIALAERTGLIEPMTDQVLLDALTVNQGLAHAGHVLHVAVNVAPPSLLDSHLPERVAEALATTGVPPSRLQLEITETSVMRSTDEALDALGRLRSLGVGLALDDFGTGYSSLARLQAMPIDQVKIDRSFLASLRGREGTSVLPLIVDLGRHLGHQVVAEGAESLDEARILAGMGCDVIQGFCFSRPLAVVDLVTWLDRYRDERLVETIECGRLRAARPQHRPDAADGAVPAVSVDGLYAALEGPLAAASDLETTATTALSVLGTALGCGYAVWWRVSKTGRLLRCQADWLGDDGVQELAQATRGLVLGRGVGAPGRAWRDTTIITSDGLWPQSEHPRGREAERCDMHATTVIPLRRQGQVTGALEFFSNTATALDAAARRALWIIGDLLAQQLHRQQAECERDETTRVLSRLASTSRIALSMLRHGTIRSEVCSSLREISGADVVLLWEPDPSRQRLHVSESLGYDGSQLSISLHDERSGAASAFASATSTFVADVAGHALPSPRLAQALGAVSALYLPVTIDGESIATISLAWRRPAEPPTQPVATALTLLADQLAIALQIASPQLALPAREPSFLATVQPASAGLGDAADLAVAKSA